jgi:tRNA C32,U32 (ribose-2'-O)-methylase TrmJ
VRHAGTELRFQSVTQLCSHTPVHNILAAPSDMPAQQLSDASCVQSDQTPIISGHADQASSHLSDNCGEAVTSESGLTAMQISQDRRGLTRRQALKVADQRPASQQRDESREGKIALVFGREHEGLTQQEIEICVTHAAAYKSEDCKSRCRLLMQ